MESAIVKQLRMTLNVDFYSYLQQSHIHLDKILDMHNDVLLMSRFQERIVKWKSL